MNIEQWNVKILGTMILKNFAMKFTIAMNFTIVCNACPKLCLVVLSKSFNEHTAIISKCERPFLTIAYTRGKSTSEC